MTIHDIEMILPAEHQRICIGIRGKEMFIMRDMFNYKVKRKNNSFLGLGSLFLLQIDIKRKQCK